MLLDFIQKLVLLIKPDWFIEFFYKNTSTKLQENKSRLVSVIFYFFTFWGLFIQYLFKKPQSMT